MRFTGTSPDGKLVEIIELPDHPWFLAVQFHPEFKSKPTAPQPLFAGFIGAAIERRNQRGSEWRRPCPGRHKAATCGRGPPNKPRPKVTDFGYDQI